MNNANANDIDMSFLDFSVYSEILEKNNVKSYSIEDDVYDIINNFLEKDVHEEAFFIVDLGKIIRQYLKWKKYLPNVVPYYAIKCNPNPVIIQILHLLGCHFDCASKNEISIVHDITKDSEKILFANPCKMCNHIKFARANDVDMMTFDSEQELYKIKLYHPYSKLILRIAVDDKNSVISFSNKFGAKIEEVNGLIQLCIALKLNLVGVSFHVGTGCFDSSQYHEAIKKCAEVYDIAKKSDITLKYVDIGGGFLGVDHQSLSFETISGDIQRGIHDFFSDKNVVFIAEPGRFFVASSHTLVVNIIGKKEVKCENEKEFIYYINDGIYGSFNCVYFEKTLPSINPYNERNEKRYKSKIFGPTCDSIDIIIENTMLPELVVGEWCYIENFGAYTNALASNFNGFQKTQIYYIITN
jgi:ornithine decarboxylase